MKTELAYRLLVTLLFASEQQWGLNAKDNRVVVFPIGFSNITYSFIYSLNYGSDAVSWEEFLPSDSANITSATYGFAAKAIVKDSSIVWL